MDKSLMRSFRQNPVLEMKRDAYLASEKEFRDGLIDAYKHSVSKVKHLHASLLFTTNSGFSILKEICRLVTQVETTINNTNWRDLAAKLGYTDLDVKCLNNLRGNVYDPTEVVLKYYAGTNKEGTIGNILQALLDLGLLPAVHQAQKHIDDLLKEIEDGKKDVIKTSPSTLGEAAAKDLVKAANFNPSVPAIFDSASPCMKNAIEVLVCNVTETAKEVEKCQKATPQAFVNKKQNKQYCKYVMLSFAGDGYTTALKVALALRSVKNKKGLPIGVLMLCENESIIQGNPGQILPDILSKMDFVVPILTEGYFSALKCSNPQARLLDERFIQFIHDIFISKYIRNNCLNLQVRPVIPSHLVNSVYNNQEFIHNSIFNAWKSDDELSTLAGNIVKSCKSKVLPL